MPEKSRWILAGLTATSLGTLASRLLGMCRDIATAALLGLSGNPVMDAFVIAFRIPNLIRRLFGEGALAASYLPVFAKDRGHSPNAGWQLATSVFSLLAIVLAALVLVGELLLALIALQFDHDSRVALVAGLAAVMLPYTIFMCLAAQFAATLQALGRFAVAALVPTIMNICWLVAVLGVAPYFEPDRAAQAYTIAVAVLVSGLLQAGVLAVALRRAGFRIMLDFASTKSSLKLVIAGFLPTLLGLAIAQLNTLLDSGIAWLLSAPPDKAGPIAWLGDSLHYPMTQGATAAIYYGERMYQFPLGVLGIAVATVIFPRLNRHAARHDHRRVAADLTVGLRLVLLLGIPASAGLVLLAEPIARLLFQRGEFTADDAARAARMIAIYGLGVWAYCATSVVLRGYYALGDTRTPLRVGFRLLLLNLVLNATLIWPFAEAGLASSTSFVAALQIIFLIAILSRRLSIGVGELLRTAFHTAVCTVVMAAAGALALFALPSGDSFPLRLARVALPLIVSAAAFFFVLLATARRELDVFTSPDEPDMTDN